MLVAFDSPSLKEPMEGLSHGVLAGVHDLHDLGRREAHIVIRHEQILDARCNWLRLVGAALGELHELLCTLNLYPNAHGLRLDLGESRA